MARYQHKRPRRAASDRDGTLTRASLFRLMVVDFEPLLHTTRLRVRVAVWSLSAITTGVVLACVSTANATAPNFKTRTNVLPYMNPLREVHGLHRGRIDMGVDYGGRGKILALGAGKVIMARDHDPGWPGGGWVMYRLSKGLFAGKYVYAAENITVRVRAGQRVEAGQPIATLHRGWPHLETGWAAGRGDMTLADVDGHRCPCGDPGGWSTIEGRKFDRLLVALGAPSGYLQPNPPHQHMPPGWPRLRPRASNASIPQSLMPLGEGWITPSPGK